MAQGLPGVLLAVAIAYILKHGTPGMVSITLGKLRPLVIREHWFGTLYATAYGQDPKLRSDVWIEYVPQEAA